MPAHNLINSGCLYFRKLTNKVLNGNKSNRTNYKYPEVYWSFGCDVGSYSSKHKSIPGVWVGAETAFP